MKMRWFLILIFSFGVMISASAQSRQITNDDLEKFRQKRLAAERDLRENYERMGFPSPAELEKQIEQSRVEREQLAARLRAEKLQREQINLQRQIVQNEANARNLQLQMENSGHYNDNNFSGYAPFGFYTFPNYGYGNYQSGRGNFHNNRQGNFGSQRRVEYRNNLPVIVPPAPPRILAPR